jgi:hypothetical protein
MDPTPLISLSVVIACVAAASVSFARGRSTLHSLMLGMAVGFPCGLVLPPVLIGLVMSLLGDARDPIRVFKAIGDIGGLMILVTVPLTIPCEAASGLVGRILRVGIDHPLMKRWSSPMCVARSFSIIISSGIGFAFAGGLIGYALGRFAPAYYRGVYAIVEPSDFDPVQVGIGLGISQGLIAGVLVGAVVVLAAGFSGRQTKQQEPTELA